jgi:transcriptional regulator with XRE-family HTH domain
MNIREISKPVTAKSLNESLAKRFGKRIALENFTLEQLADARNKVRTTLSQIETNESFNSVKNDTYQKSKLFLDVLNAEITERGDVDEAAKPDFLDMDKDGDKKEPMKKAIKDKKKKKQVKEGAEEAAELVMAAKDMVDRITSWMEDTAEMQTESMLELADSIRDEMGSEQSEAFTNSVKPALEALYTALEATREATTAGVGILTGEGDPVEPMGGEEEVPAVDADADPMADVDVDAEVEVPAEDDGMTAAEPAVGGEEEAGRTKRESVERSRKLGTILSKKK